ncbi:hypothetical protein MTO98_26225 [Mucilaginibacter sp. SMC90]|uniref:hypothetical protein n=1 Tax=Mucilaginibacter sp. SMC90 TaxID=2929803 RepID=UPI001FB56DC5|nr:hypothetical protein [Mucilaginibacter sp. SMC90]UOE47912.1 hypothetical protein MTO98_26225 [Mucilaginibacter sp. SMC90]
MKNPFEQKDSSALIDAIVAGAALAGGLVWLFLTESGGQALESWKTALKENGKDFAAELASDKTGVSKDITKPAVETVVE